MPSTTAWERVSKAWRLKFGVDPKGVEVAAVCSVKPPSVANWDHRNGIRHEHARALARKTGARWEYLQYGYGPVRASEAASEDFEALRHLWEHMTTEQRQALLRRARELRFIPAEALDSR